MQQDSRASGRYGRKGGGIAAGEAACAAFIREIKKERIVKKLIAILLIATLALALAGTAVYAENKKVVVGMSVPQLANPYFVSVMNGLQERCDAYGYQLITVDAGYDVA